MSTPRAIRIPRSGGSAFPGPNDPAKAGPRPTRTRVPSAPPPTKVDRRRNQAATERAFRLTLLYVGTLVVLYATFVVLDRSAPGGTSAAVATGLVYFTLIAAALGLGGAYVALSPAPRAVELHPDSFVVIEWWGHRRTFPPIGELQTTVVRRYPSSFLSSRPVQAIELGTLAGGRRTYQFETDLFSVRAPEPRSRIP